MTTYLKGSRRLAVIHRWLQGIDDPEYEVLPTKKEGKYIVRKRTAPIQKPNEDEQEHEQEDLEPEPVQQPKLQPAPKPIPKQVQQPQPESLSATACPIRKQVQQLNYDPTVNLEILETLKLLGDEIRTKRERKEQKQLINQVINKRMRQPVIAKSRQVEEEYYSDDSIGGLRYARESEQPVVLEQRSQESSRIFKSRIRR